MTGDDLAEKVAAVLGAHEDPPGWTNDPDGGGMGGLVYECNCGDMSPVLADQYVGQADVDVAAAWHRRHLAAALVPLIREREAAAWNSALEATAWCLDNGEPSAAAALAYVAKNNPYAGSEGER